MNNKVRNIIMIGVLAIAVIIGIVAIVMQINKKDNVDNNVNQNQVENQQNNNTTDNSQDSEENEGGIDISDYGFYKVTNEEDYYAVEKSINTYLSTCKEKNVENIVKLLSKNYMKNNNIDTTNVLSKVKSYPNFENFFLDDLYYYTVENDSESYGVYYAYGTVWNNGYSSHENVIYSMKIDIENSFFELTPQDMSILGGETFEKWITQRQSEYIEEFKAKNVNNQVEEDDEQEVVSQENEIENEEEIVEEQGNEEEIIDEDEESENNEINYLYAQFNKNIIVERIFKKIMVNCIFNNGVESTYNMLTDECKSKYFNNVNDFTEFVNKYKNPLITLKVTNAQYQEADNENYNHLYKFSSGNTISFLIYYNDPSNIKIAITR